jgi:ribosomal protein S12 methylthiotransferase
MRGGHVSKTIEDLVKEAKHLAKNGTKELILIAQDLTYYGLDIYNDRKLGDLLKHLSDIEGIEWIRMQYAYPSQFPMDVLDVMNERSNVCKYLDMPLQHITDNMLKSMRRGITKRRTIELVNDIRAKVPDIALRTTLIAGYPGETEKDVEEVLKFVEEMRFDRLGVFTYSHEENTHAYSLVDNIPNEEKRFDRLGVFTYSHEENTHAYSLVDNIPDEEKQERADQIMAVQQDISLELNQAKIGKQYKVLVDRIEKDHFIGRTEFDSPEVDNEVLITAKDEYLRIGDFVQVEIESAEEFDLYAKKIG